MSAESPLGAPAAAYPTERTAPTAVRLAAWFFLLASVAGFASGILELLTSLGTGILMVPVPLAVGVSGLALFRGLRAGDRRAWRWARRISVVAVVALFAMLGLSVFAPARATFSALGGSWPVASVRPALVTVIVLAIAWFAWLFRGLGSPPARRFFAPGPATPEAVPIPPTEARTR